MHSFSWWQVETIRVPCTVWLRLFSFMPYKNSLCEPEKIYSIGIYFERPQRQKLVCQEKTCQAKGARPVYPEKPHHLVIYLFWSGAIGDL